MWGVRTGVRSMAPRTQQSAWHRLGSAAAPAQGAFWMLYNDVCCLGEELGGAPGSRAGHPSARFLSTCSQGSTEA